MIDIIITSYNEPKATLRAVNSFLSQKTKEKIRITVVDPFPEVEKFLKKNIKNKNFKFFLDPGEGKSYALNLLFQEYGSDNKNDLFVLTDGDVFVSKNTLSEILTAFKDKETGCVTGKPVAVDDKNTKYGYWAHISFAGIDKTRLRLSNENKFFEASGYLFAIRKGIVFDFPIEGSEDGIISYLVWKKGYKVKYVPEAEVYVKNPGNWKDWLNQKIRNIKGHENYSNLFPDMPRTKTFWNEVKEGAFFAIRQPRTLSQFLWTIELYFARLYLYFRAFKEMKNKKSYADGWRENEIESTKPLD